MYHDSASTDNGNVCEGSIARHWRFAGFDLDGTLIRGSTVLLHVGHHLGHSSLVKDLVDGYESFKLSNHEVSTKAAALFAGLRKSDMFEMMADIPHLRHIAEAVEFMHNLGIHCSIATVTFDFASEWFASRFGFDSYSGIELEYDSTGRLTGEVIRHVDEHDKARFVAEQRRAIGANPSDSFYVGDARSDLPTFEVVGFAIALNGSPEARAAAHASVDADSLMAALRVVPGLIDQTP